MTSYIQFTTEDNETILVEVDDKEFSSEEGTVKVGIKDNIQGTVATAQSIFSTAVKSAIKYNVQGLIEAVHSLPKPPSEIEITFGLKVTAEVGNVAVGKMNGDTNYAVKLVWKGSTNEQK
ncbi:CU044_2847 family protein [Dolichospermum circinale CS-545/17]|nr:CU044_2847 family protein [Dolichospermum circinale CS-545/17]